MSAEIPIDCYVGQSREWLKNLETKLLAQIAGGGRVITSENDGGLSVSYKVAGTPQQHSPPNLPSPSIRMIIHPIQSLQCFAIWTPCSRHE